jgi:hypothetical protein
MILNELKMILKDYDRYKIAIKIFYGPVRYSSIWSYIHNNNPPKLSNNTYNSGENYVTGALIKWLN